MICPICYRLNEELKCIEKQHKIPTRWETNHPEYLQLIKKHDANKQLKLLYKMRDTAVEKCFLISTKHKYAGEIESCTV